MAVSCCRESQVLRHGVYLTVRAMYVKRMPSTEPVYVCERDVKVEDAAFYDAVGYATTAFVDVPVTVALNAGTVGASLVASPALLVAAPFIAKQDQGQEKKD